MNWLFGAMGGRNAQPPNPLVASSGKWLTTCLGIYTALFWTPDAWAVNEPWIIDAILARYQDGWATFVYWVLRIAAYPLMFFATKLTLGVAFVSIVLFISLHLFSGRR